MALRLIPSSFACDCGHLSHFSEATVREMEREAGKGRKAQRLGDSEANEHRIEFQGRSAVSVIYPKRGRCPITGWRY